MPTDATLLSEAYSLVQESTSLPESIKKQMFRARKSEKMLDVITKFYDDLRLAYAKGDFEKQAYLNNYHSTSNIYSISEDKMLDDAFIKHYIRLAKKPSKDKGEWPSGEAMKQEILARQKISQEKEDASADKWMPTVFANKL